MTAREDDGQQHQMETPTELTPDTDVHWKLRARQLLRFHHAPDAWATRNLVTNDDLDRARLLQPDYLHKDTPEEEDWPPSWESNPKSLRSVFSSPAWRKKPLSPQLDVTANPPAGAQVTAANENETNASVDPTAAPDPGSRRVLALPRPHPRQSGASAQPPAEIETSSTRPARPTARPKPPPVPTTRQTRSATAREALTPARVTKSPTKPGPVTAPTKKRPSPRPSPVESKSAAATTVQPKARPASTGQTAPAKPRPSRQGTPAPPANGAGKASVATTPPPPPPAETETAVVATIQPKAHPAPTGQAPPVTTPPPRPPTPTPPAENVETTAMATSPRFHPGVAELSADVSVCATAENILGQGQLDPLPVSRAVNEAMQRLAMLSVDMAVNRPLPQLEMSSSGRAPGAWLDEDGGQSSSSVAPIPRYTPSDQERYVRWLASHGMRPSRSLQRGPGGQGI
ncbi:hypothetical protein QBC39DRAFT_358146 [Podospora conica]|nr:hypothetical protein QBC39DRAFT_358146 [Schizothecium conicum]